MKQFVGVLINTLIANTTSSFLWFGLTFWAYLETRSLLATGIIGGSYMLFVALSSLWFGVIVDHNKKKFVMVLSSIITLAAYSIAGILYLLFDEKQLVDWSGILFWLFAGVILIGGVVENMRNIALSTTVTILVPKEKRDKANGLVGAVQGVGFLVTSVFSGLSIGFLGMGGTLIIAIVFTAFALFQLFFVHIDEEKIVHDPELANKKVDIKGSIAAIRQVPGLLSLILFTTINNLIGGVFMALMDPYGLTMFSVQIWGIVLGITSLGFIVGGAIVAKKGLGKSPLRTLLLVNLGVAGLGFFFTLREWAWLYVVGIFIFMALMPAAEAAEQTVIQRVVPLKRQGRVFGFAQSVEAACSPITSFMIGPLAQFMIVPYVVSEAGRQQLGWLLGDGHARGIALVFIIASVLTAVLVLLAFRTKAYQTLSAYYKNS
jgi:DHA3 family multidrug efflux protein-like MFS transporter